MEGLPGCCTIHLEVIMKNAFYLWILIVVMTSFTVPAQNDGSTEYVRHYQLVFGPVDELEPFSVAGLTLNKALSDVYYRGISKRLPSGVDKWTGPIWSIFWTFCTTMYPHDGGHWARAEQVGGKFSLTSFGFPFPVMKMDLPENGPQKNETLTSIGGFEINFMMRRRIHMDFYERQYVFADQLINAFIQDVFYPFYAFVLVYADPTNPDVWTDTRGDPVEAALSVYKGFTGREPVMDNGKVDPDLIQQYREATIISLPWTMLNPMFFRSLKAFSAKMSDRYGLMETPWMLGDTRFSWSWGTHYHSSPLGYELYLTNYFRIYDKLYTLSLKAGRPYKNLGMNVTIPKIFEKNRFQMGCTVDAWSQDIFGNGGNIEIDARYRFHRNFDVVLKTGYKSEGYLIGRRVDEAPLFLAGGSFYFE